MCQTLPPSSLVCYSVASREALWNPHVPVKLQATALLKSLPHTLRHSRASNPDLQAPSPAPGLPLKEAPSPSAQGEQTLFYTSLEKVSQSLVNCRAPTMFTNSKLRDPAGTATPTTPNSGNGGDARKWVSKPHITDSSHSWLELPHQAQTSLKAHEVSLASISLRRRRHGGTSEGQAVFPRVLPLRTKGWKTQEAGLPFPGHSTGKGSSPS